VVVANTLETWSVPAMEPIRHPNASEVLDLMDEMQRSETERYRLQSGWNVFRAAVEAGLVDEQGIDVFARRMQELHDDGLIAFRSRAAGAMDRPVWDGVAIQERHDWRVTAQGRHDAHVYRQMLERDGAQGTETSPGEVPRREGFRAATSGSQAVIHDVFISHAGEDKEGIARPLAVRLRELGYRVWFDEFELQVGMRLRRSIDRGLAGSRFGIVILSPSFFAKEWPQRELDGLAALEAAGGGHRILPVWHQVDQSAVATYSPMLADRVAVRSDRPLDDVVAQLMRAIGPPDGTDGSAARTPTSRLSPMPPTVELSPVLLGAQLLRLIDRSLEMVFELDALPAGPARREAAELFDEARDLMDVLSEYSLVDRDRLEEEMSGRLVHLLDQGVAVLGGTYARTLRGPSGSEGWPGAVVRAILLTEAQAVGDADAVPADPSAL
jgi:hypothetical protein